MRVLPPSLTNPSTLASAALLAALCCASHSTALAQTACFAPWNAATAYTGGQTASESGVNYTANWWTQNQNPASNNGVSGSGEPWAVNGSCSGSTTPPTTPPPTNPTPPSGSTTHLFAPYVDMGISGGVGGTLPTDTLPNGTTILSVVQSLQAAGVQVILSFGGASGTEPALNCTSASQLQALYQSVLTRYNVSMLDFDIEGGAVSNQASITLRDQALVGLKAANPGLVISYTLPVLPTGLVSTGVNILNSAKADGLALDVVNVMAMDYGSSSDNGGAMGTDATDAAAETEAQLQAAGLTSTTIGVTPMVGINDTNTEFFQLTDATTLLNYAESNSYITRLGIWSFARDNGGCPGQTYASPTCSGVSESSYQFTGILNAY